jgi:light-regulated signal transduction histidine kinase (bacteriophytochrome)
MYNQRQELFRRTQELERSNGELESFSYSVSHDLRAPLRAISGFSQALMEEYEDQLDDTAKGYFTRICNATERMGFLIDDLLNLSRVARTEMHVTDVDLGKLARKLCSDLAATSKERDVTITIGDSLSATGDARLLEVVLDNLLGNAWKFTAETSKPHIIVDKMEESGVPVFFVRDNGVGFDMQYANQLFVPFQRLHEASRFPGTGIGLATIQRIIHKHGGAVWAESEPGKGATFYFTLGRRADIQGANSGDED